MSTIQTPTIPLPTVADEHKHGVCHIKRLGLPGQPVEGLAVCGAGQAGDLRIVNGVEVAQIFPLNFPIHGVEVDLSQQTCHICALPICSECITLVRYKIDLSGVALSLEAYTR
jgi:hypothetical protein